MTSCLHRRARIVAPLLMLLAGPVFAAVAPASKAAGPALQKTAEYRMLSPRFGTGAIVHGGAIFITGGSGAGATPDIERFDPATGKTERVFEGLHPRRFHAAIEYNGRIYLFGGEGFGLSGQYFERRIEVYDIATRTVSVGPDWPEPRSHMAAVRLGTKVLFTGGTRFKSASIVQTTDTEIFDLETNTWSKGVPMPTPRQARAAVVTGFVIVAGGYRGRNTPVAEVEMFVPQENVWKKLPALSQKVSAHSVAFLGQHLFLFGDYDELDQVLAYDLRNRTTSVVATKFTGFRHTTALVHNEVIYVIGGRTGLDRSESDLIQAFKLAP